MNPPYDDEIDLVDLVRTLWEERVLIATITGLSILIAGAYAFLATPIYRAEAVVVDVSEESGGRGALLGQLGGLASLAGLDTASLNANPRKARAVLKSRALSEEFIRRNDLIPTLFSNEEDPPSLWEATRVFNEKVRSVSEDARSGLVAVSVEWEDPRLAAEWANGLVALANELLRQQDREDAERNIEYLNEQIGQTTLVGLQQAMFNLIEAETKTLMLANARQEYAFAVVDPASTPERKSRPRRSMILLLGAFVGASAGLMAVLLRRFVQRIRETTRFSS